MRLRRLCLAIFAFLRFLSEPIQILVTAIESSNPQQRKCSCQIQLSGFLRWRGRGLVFTLRGNPDFLQKWFDRLFAA
jgi:hypothetical protein